MASVQIVAEIGTNYTPHDLQSAQKMIQVAASAGVDMVKFQAFDVSRMARPKWWKEKSKPWQLDRRWHPKLKEHAEYFNVGYFVSVFDKSSYGEAAQLLKQHEETARSEAPTVTHKRSIEVVEIDDEDWRG